MHTKNDFILCLDHSALRCLFIASYSYEKLEALELVHINFVIIWMGGP